MSDEIVPDLYRLAFMPGCFRCPTCGFQLSKQTISPSGIGCTEADRESEHECRFDGSDDPERPIRKETWEVTRKLIAVEES